MEKLKIIKQLIIDFEQGILSCERAVKEINIYSTTEVDITTKLTYQRPN